MILNNLDTLFSRSKLRCVVLFLLLSVLFGIAVVEMLRCSVAVLKYASPQSYMQLFEDARVSSFFLAKIVLNAMEYLYAGKGMLWVFFKSLDAADVLLISTAVMILFQDGSSLSAQMMRVFTFGLLILFLAVLGLYSWFLFQASLQLTTEAGFALLRTGALVSEYSGIGLLILCIVMNAALWLIKNQ